MRVSFSVHEFSFCSFQWWVDSTLAFYQSESFFISKINLWICPQSLIQRASASITGNIILHLVFMSRTIFNYFSDATSKNYSNHSIVIQRYLPYQICNETKQWTYQRIKIWRYDKQSREHINISRYEDAMRYFDISLYNDITIERCIQRHGNDRRKCENENHSSASSLKTRLHPKIPHATIPPDWNKRDTAQPRSKINASRLHYLILLLRTVASYNISHRYPRLFSLNKPVNHWQGYAVSIGKARA